MNGLLYAVTTAFALGLLTAVSPCTLAATISGAAFISRSMTSPKYALLVGVLLSLGRIITFSVVGGIMIAAGHIIGRIALSSQIVGGFLLGCVLLVVGIFFLDLIPVNITGGSGFLTNTMVKMHGGGLLGALLLGMLYGLAFCPYSAALFFGMLIPLAVKTSGGYVLPLLFGLGVNVPVLVYTGMVYFGMKKARHVMQRVSQSWTLISKGLGVVLISAATYYLYPYVPVKEVPLDWLPYAVGGILFVWVVFTYKQSMQKKIS